MSVPLQPPPSAAEPPLQRRFGPADEIATLPLPPVPSAHSKRLQRDVWLRVTTFAVLLGAILTILYAWFVALPPNPGPLASTGSGSLERVLVPLLAILTVAGVIVLDRIAVLGVVLMLAGTAFGLTGGAVWLLPGTVLGCIWAARRHHAARNTIGFLLLVPSAAAVFYGVVSALTVLTRTPASWFSPQVMAPMSLAQAIMPLEFLPVAFLGAWLLVHPLSRQRI